jgi:hypothetical protein
MTKIEKLIEQATEDCMGIKRLDAQLLAELIIEECSKICDEKQKVYSDRCLNATDFRDKNMWSEGSVVAQAIKNNVKNLLKD